MAKKKKPTKRNNRSSQSTGDKILNRRFLIISIVVGILAIFSFAIELPKKISDSIKVFPVNTLTATPQQLAFEPATENETLVIIASFDDRSEGKYQGIDIAQYIFEKIETETKKYPIKIRIQRLYEKTNENTANSILENYQASLLIWGWYDSLTVNPRITLPSGFPQFYYSSPATPTIDFDLNIIESSGLNTISVSISDTSTIEAVIRNEIPDQTLLVSNYALGLVLFSDGYLKDAMDTFRKIESEMTLYEYPPIKSDLIHVMIGNTFLATGDYEQSLTYLNKALEANPKASYYYNRGMDYLLMGDIQKAEQDFNLSLGLDPDYLHPYIGIGLINYHNEEYSDALTNFEYVVQNGDDKISAIAANNKGLTFEKMGDFEAANFSYNFALILDPWNLSTYLNWGDLSRIYAKNYSLAIKYYNIVIESENGKCRICLRDAYRGRGNSYGEQGNFTKANDDLSEALRIDPLDYRILIERSNVLFDIGQKENSRFYIGLAIADLNSALELTTNPKSHYFIYVFRSQCFSELGDVSSEISDLDTAISLEPDKFHPYFLRAITYYFNLNEKEKALSDAEKALSYCDLQDCSEIEQFIAQVKSSP